MRDLLRTTLVACLFFSQLEAPSSFVCMRQPTFRLFWLATVPTALQVLLMGALVQETVVRASIELLKPQCQWLDQQKLHP